MGLQRPRVFTIALVPFLRGGLLREVDKVYCVGFAREFVGGVEVFRAKLFVDGYGTLLSRAVRSSGEAAREYGHRLARRIRVGRVVGSDSFQWHQTFHEGA